VVKYKRARPMVDLIAVLTSALMRPPNSHSYDERAPDFVRLAEALGAKGLGCAHTADLDQSHAAMPAHAGAVLLAWRSTNRKTICR
jgi:thiamine pyrophosphate-dependent acetolactate synthase large subunit-like protein